MRLPSKQIAARALIALSVLVPAGCGGSSDAASTASTTTVKTVKTSSMTSAELAKRVEAICAHGRLRSLRFEPHQKGESEREAITTAVESTLLPAIQGVIDQIEELGAPQKQKAEIEALLTSMQRAVNEAEELDKPAVEKVEALLEQSGRLARKDGLESCIYG
jgi:hypothetical protein